MGCVCFDGLFDPQVDINALVRWVRLRGSLGLRLCRAAFGFTNFANYRIRALLYAGKPNWTLLDTLTPP